MKGTLIALLTAAALTVPAMAEQPTAKPDTRPAAQDPSLAPLHLTPAEANALKKNGITKWVKPKPGNFIG